MKTQLSARWAAPCALAWWLIVPDPAWASSALEDKIADVVKWLVVIAVPIIGIWVFWMVHILPEKIAERRHHPQAEAIKTLCLLSLFFGGLLWPIAWLWAYSKPVLYKMAYGRDTHEEPESPGDAAAVSQPAGAYQVELEHLRRQLAALEARLPDQTRA